MKRKLIILIIFTAASVALFAAQSIFDSVSAKSEGSAVNITWTTNSENNLSRFEIERKAEGGAYVRAATEKAKGSPSRYSFTDNDAFLKNSEKAKYTDGTLSKNVYSYRIKAIYNDNTSLTSEETFVTHSISGIKRTWGMIKEMFR